MAPTLTDRYIDGGSAVERRSVAGEPTKKHGTLDRASRSDRLDTGAGVHGCRGELARR